MANELIPITADQMRIAAAGVVPLPPMQAPIWDHFTQARRRRDFGRYLFRIDGKDHALISLVYDEVHSVPFLWAKAGPVWLRGQTPAHERALRDALVEEVRRRDRSVVFIRLHARYSASDTRELLQSITYDKTALIRCFPEESDTVAALPKEGQRSWRRAAKKIAGRDVVFRTYDADTLDDTTYAQIYDVLEETARRDGFHPHRRDLYRTLLTSLGAQYARIYVIELDGVVVAWNFVVENDQRAYVYYGAHSHAARDVLAMEYLDIRTAVELGQRGVVSVDLMGVDSPRVPELYGVGRYKRRFGEIVDTDGAWDLPVRQAKYHALVVAKRLRDRVRTRH